jgi:hypothetical protein
MDASQIAEHMEVVGSDGQHVGTVDGVEGERIKLTKTDEDAGGEHHYIPLTAVSQVTDVVMLTESAENAKTNWTTE